MFRHADVVCLCLVCILWQFSMTCSLLMLVEDAIGDHCMFVSCVHPVAVLNDLQFANAG